MSLETKIFFQALSTFAGRIAATDDPRAHQNAAKQLQRDLERLKPISQIKPTERR